MSSVCYGAWLTTDTKPTPTVHVEQAPTFEKVCAYTQKSDCLLGKDRILNTQAFTSVLL